ncbi:MAG: sigma-70 family RNA polymerase sigma factor [Verrucomicrobia bacterium]|nr:sigma-70 family RNA polymerase sigma factor [Verrucomicrobiota bacterium]
MGEIARPQNSTAPVLEALRSADERSNAAAWSQAYSLLWRDGMMVARCALSGAEHETQREDIVATALSQVMRGVIEGTSESYNGMHGFDDVLGMMRSVTRCRVVDFLRQRERRREDAVEELPEPPPAGVDNLPYTMAELMTQVEMLDPPLPDIFSDRFLLGWNTSEIAERRNMNVNTLLTYFAKGFKLLRERLQRLEGTL